jgi:hypothetical protein
VRTIKLTGPFSVEEIDEFLAVLRKIDAANPSGLYRITITDPGTQTLAEAERIVERILPPLPEQINAWARARYRDDSFPSQVCEKCGQTYHGPAVYCSLDCAVADA